MKKYFVLLWLLLPLPVLVLHFGRGQQWLARDKAYAFVKQAEIAEQREDWQQADQLYRDAAKCLTSESRDLKLRLDLAQVRTRFRMGDAVAAIDSADKLLDEPAMATMPAEFQRESRELAGRIHYYAGWVMRLEGAKRELWMEEAELARQNFRLLAEQDIAPANAPVNTANTNDSSSKQQEDLESAVQLQRLSLTELMARPLPKEGRSMAGQGLSEQMGKRRGQRGKGNKPGVGESEGEEPSKGAGMQRFEPGSGS
jgi:hypothetical protein